MCRGSEPADAAVLPPATLLPPLRACQLAAASHSACSRSLSQVDADVQPNYVRVTTGHAIHEGRKKSYLQLLLPSEVLTDSSSAKRSATTGHLLLTCPKLHPVVVSKAPQPKKQAKALAAPPATSGMLAPPPATPGASLKGAVDVRSIVASSPARSSGEAAAALKPTLGPDFDDEDEVPPLM